MTSPGGSTSALVASHTFDERNLIWHAGYGPNGDWVSGFNVKYYFTGMFLGHTS